MNAQTQHTRTTLTHQRTHEHIITATHTSTRGQITAHKHEYDKYAIDTKTQYTHTHKHIPTTP